jgi:hypothetical protein
MEELQSILEMWEQSWQNPAMRHAMLVHFPIVLAFLLVPLAFLTAIWPGTFRKTLIIFCFLIGLTMAGTAWLAKDAGAQAHAALGSAIAQDVQTNIIAHGTAAVRIWWLALSACGILVLACLGNNLWKVIARGLFFLATVTLAAYIMYVADLGGRLVYVDEVGVGVHPLVSPPPAAPGDGTPLTPSPPLGTPPTAAPIPSPPPPKPSRPPPPPSAAANQAQQVLSQAGLYEAKPGVWYLKQVNNYSPRAYNRLSTDGDVRAALRTLGGQLPPRTEWTSSPVKRP